MTPIEQAHAARRAAAKLLKAIAAEVLPGRCMFCERELPDQSHTPGRKRRKCHRKKCQRDWRRIYAEGYRTPTRTRRHRMRRDEAGGR